LSKTFDNRQQLLQHVERDPAAEQWRYVDERQPRKYWYPKKPSQEPRFARLLNDLQQQDPSKYLGSKSQDNSKQKMTTKTLGGSEQLTLELLAFCLDNLGHINITFFELNNFRHQDRHLIL
jgi:hypothetical protein